MGWVITSILFAMRVALLGAVIVPDSPDRNLSMKVRHFVVLFKQRCHRVC
jgi:hypothetical protein